MSRVFKQLSHVAREVFACAACLLSLSMCACEKVDLPTEEQKDPEELTDPQNNDPTNETGPVDHSKSYTYKTDDIWFERDGLKIYGQVFVPDGIGGKLPLVILSHGFGGTNSSMTSYARAVAEKGYAAVTFDFYGATSGNRSDGETTQMSIRTEEADLKAIIDDMKSDDRIDSDRIYLAGASQGGMVSAMTAADYPSDVRAIVLIYPALVIPDDVHEWYPDRNSIPKTFSLWGTRLGRIYATDAYDYDIYTELPKFQKAVLIIHGTADGIAPISYSERMVQSYKNAELKRIEGAGHGFYGSQATQALNWALEFLSEQEKNAGTQENGNSSNIIAADIKDVPSSYRQTASRQGKVVRMDYQTTSYASGGKMNKYALVYLPYGYDDDTDKRYNVLYIMHGGGGSQATYLGGVGQNSAFKNILDHMILEGECDPCIVVAPTFYLSGDGDTSVGNSGVAVEQFPTELLTDLVPAVDKTYRTIASREHRAFGGFSMGSVCTWWTFCKGLDTFKYFVPTSGDCWALGTQAGSSNPDGTAKYLADTLEKSGFGPGDFFIHVMTGSEDIAEPMLTPQTEAMKKISAFRFGTDKSRDNIWYAVLPGATHTASYAFQYAYNALLHLWKNEKESE